MNDVQIKVFATAAELADAAAERFAELAKRAISERGAFTVALAGGSTPKAMYARLAGEPFRSAVDWGKVEIYFGDERCVAPESSESNYRSAHEALLARVPIPPGHVHRIRGEIDPKDAAVEYGKLLKERFGDGGVDLALLGMGEDGHTASLFPETTALDETRHRCVANYVEKLKRWRVTMTAPFLNRSADVVVLVSGAAKAARLREVLEGMPDPLRLPVQLIQPELGRLTWMMDAAAAGMEQDDPSIGGE